MRLRIPLSFLALVLTASPVISKTTTSFCKCICGSESEIIALNPDPNVSPNYSPSGLRVPARLLSRWPLALAEDEGDDESGDKSDEGDDDGGSKEEDDGKDEEDPTQRQKTCIDCNRSFCLKYNLPKCKTLPEEDVSTQCFQRDSSKDQAVVLLFIGLTAGLLSWALVRPWVNKLRQHSLNARDRNAYVPVSANEG